MDVEALQEGELHSEELGIDLAGTEDEDFFKWFLANVLYGGDDPSGLGR